MVNTQILLKGCSSLVFILNCSLKSNIFKQYNALCHPSGTVICARWTEVDIITITNTTGFIECNKTELYKFQVVLPWLVTSAQQLLCTQKLNDSTAVLL